MPVSPTVKGLIGGVLVLAAAGCGAATATSAPARPPSAPSAASAPARPPSAPSAASAPSPSRSAAEAAEATLTGRLAPLERSDDDHFAVAVDDLTTGEQASYGGADEFVTGSIVKVDILAALLYQAQQSGTSLTADQQQLATTMIEISDNASAEELYDEAGGAPGISSVNRVLGLTQTTIGTDGYFGLTTTTVSDQIRLLREVFTSASPLTASSRAYIQYLMNHVEAAQSFGISAAASAGTTLEIKDGYLPNPTLWAVDSIGEVVRNGKRLLIAVLSDDNAGLQAGSSVTEAAAVQAAATVAG
jgi:Beta-lactamase enzyme family